MKKATVYLYQYSELTGEAKDKAADWFRSGNTFDERYSATYEDAKQAGISIESWDCDSASFVRNMDIRFIDGAFNTANYMRENHGKECTTYRAAVAYDTAFNELADDENTDDIEGSFNIALSAAYTKMLQAELDEMDSEEFIADTMEANEYTFLHDGTRFEPKKEEQEVA